MKKQIKLKLLLTFLLLVPYFNYAGKYPVPDEGMWLPMFIDRLNYVDMQKAGLKLTPQEIYSINNSSIKDAIVSLGFFCTAEVVSPEGLIFTNHHCGYDAIQKLSSIEHDYLKDGYWAKSKEEELPAEGLTATFLIRMEDVTPIFNSKLKDITDPNDREKIINTITDSIEDATSENGKYTADVKSFYAGNEFYLFVYQTFTDIRFVGAPPSSIGKFGFDTDNWMWPRHTGDFSIFRIYADKNNQPAKYSPDNVPYKPKYFLPISIKGVENGDYSMIMGYPGSTDRYLSSYGVKQLMEENNPTIIKVRTKKLEIINNNMQNNDTIRIKYSSKQSRCSNYWKYAIGQNKGLKRLNVIDRKKELEMQFMKWIEEDNNRKKEYSEVIPTIEKSYADLKKYNLPFKYIEEAILEGPEAIYFSYNAISLYSALKNIKNENKTIKAYADTIKQNKNEKVKLFKQKLHQENIETLNQEIINLKNAANKFFKDYDVKTDRQLFEALLSMYYNDVPKDMQISIFKLYDKKYKSNIRLFANDVYNNSIFTDKNRLMKYLDKPDTKTIENDMAFKILVSVIQFYRTHNTNVNSIEEKLANATRLFIKAQREMMPNKKFYPDANSTMRLTYGNISDYYPADAIHYNYYTTTKGIIEKEEPGNYEFEVPQRLIELIKNKDFGKYAKNDELRICFISNNDITGGNSGSPVMNDKGQLIGIAFDGNWEAMSGDIAFEPQLQRTISVDIRYVLFIIDKFANAKNIISELSIVE